MKKTLLVILVILAFFAICLPLSLTVALVTTVFMWPIFIVVRLIDEINHKDLETRTSNTIEEAIFAFYGFAALIFCIPLELIQSK